MTAKRFLTDDDKTELSNGIKTAQNNSTEAIRIARELSENVGEGAMSEIAEFYNSDTNMSADNLTVGVAIVPISEEVNAELFALFGGSFAFVMTMFKTVKSATTQRAQIALPYDGEAAGMASRFYDGAAWSDWQDSSNSKLTKHEYLLTAEAEGQTNFIIPMVTFDAVNDVLIVQSGITMLFPEADYTVSGSTITLKKGVPAGRTIGIRVLKNIILPDGEKTFSGALIEPGTIPLDRLQELPTAEQVGAATPEYVDNAVANVKIPMTASQTDITAGTTELEDGALYLVYE